MKEASFTLSLCQGWNFFILRTFQFLRRHRLLIQNSLHNCALSLTWRNSLISSLKKENVRLVFHRRDLLQLNWMDNSQKLDFVKHRWSMFFMLEKLWIFFCKLRVSIYFARSRGVAQVSLSVKCKLLKNLYFLLWCPHDSGSETLDVQVKVNQLITPLVQV